MGKSISLFSNYKHTENRTTNYCLLILKMIYEESPKYLAQVLSVMFGDEVGSKVGVDFQQQTKRGPSIPDGLITQQSFTIYIETKIHSWFHNGQLKRHLAALYDEPGQNKILLALGMFESSLDRNFEEIRLLCEQDYSGQIQFGSVSYEELLDAIQSIPLSKNLVDIVAEFRSYLDEQNLLPAWKERLDVINCVGLPHEILDGNVYMCPAKGGAYSHQRCKFFGMYRDKNVEKIALIEAVIDVLSPQDALVKWINTPGDPDKLSASLIKRAKAKIIAYRKNPQYPLRVFLLGELFDTSFRKDSPRGLQGSKLYFDVSTTGETESEGLANQLNGKVWSDFR